MFVRQLCVTELRESTLCFGRTVECKPVNNMMEIRHQPPLNLHYTKTSLLQHTTNTVLIRIFVVLKDVWKSKILCDAFALYQQCIVSNRRYRTKPYHTHFNIHAFRQHNKAQIQNVQPLQNPFLFGFSISLYIFASMFYYFIFFNFRIFFLFRFHFCFCFI